MTHPVAGRYKTALRHLRTTTAGHVGTAFAGLDSHDQAASDRFIGAVVPVVAAAQGRASALTAAYLGIVLPAVLGHPVDTPAVPEDDVTGAAARNGTEPGDVYRRSFVGLWVALAAGTAAEVALAAAQARIEQAVDTDIALTARATSQDILAAEPGVSAYERDSSGGCDLCQEDDGHVYSTDDLMPLHPGCNCIGVPISGDPPEPKDESDVVEVVEHDELGPVLWAKGDEFHLDSGG